ncbi:MAG: hypothetical protein AMQ22_00089 [Candidatus Methanofastidiosum methylothiophilum]|uniref:Uncharacterized protein n=1 Tax=Candidatus Methanofastidiosum methylothiophilum TaxID=1705564 RepID=A0A150J9H2_9EURY|nr:MAG: hypothetical protein AMQ22_00089 [Candidatus Methanofastidiosum methylthiophilus]
MNLKFFDWITTILLALIPVILFFQVVILGYVNDYSPELLIAVQLFLAILSKYASDKRVTEAVETIKRLGYVTWILNVVYAVAPIVILYQAVIMGAIPAVYVPIAVLVFAVLYQITTEQRVQIAKRIVRERVIKSNP